MFTTGKQVRAVDSNRFMTYLRWRVELPVHGGPRFPTQTLPLQVNILIWVLLLCGDEAGIQCSANIMSAVKLATVREQRVFQQKTDEAAGSKRVNGGQ